MYLSVLLLDNDNDLEITTKSNLVTYISTSCNGKMVIPERPQEHTQVEIRFVEVVVGDLGQRHVEEDSGHVTCSDIRSITCTDALTLVTDCCEDAIEDDNVDNVSTKGHIDKDELPLLPNIRIYMEEKRPNILPLSLIFSGCITIIISVSICMKNYQSLEISKLQLGTVIIPQSLANILE